MKNQIDEMKKQTEENCRWSRQSSDRQKFTFGIFLAYDLATPAVPLMVGVPP